MKTTTPRLLAFAELVAFSGIVAAFGAAPPLHAASPTGNSLHQPAINSAMSVVPGELEKLVPAARLVPTWREHGSKFWFISDRAGGTEYLRVDPKKKSIVPLFDRQKLDAALRKATDSKAPPPPLKLEGFSYDFEKDEVSFDYANHRWGYSSRGDRLSQLPKVESGYSPDRRWQVQVRDYNLYLEDKLSGEVRQLTTDGTADRPYARPVATLRSMVAQGTSVPHLDPDVVWSPDSSRFVTYRLNLEGVRRLSAVQSTPPGGAPPRAFEYVYALAGDERAGFAQTLIVTAASGVVTEVKSLTQELVWYYGPQFRWNRDGSAIFQVTMSRGLKSIHLYSIDAASGSARVLTEDRANLFIDVSSHDWRYIAGADAIAWLADPQGWNHVHMVDRAGKRHQLTTGEWLVTHIAGSDESGDHLFVTGSGRESGRDPYLTSLYRVDTRSGSTQSLTPEVLDHEVYVSPDGRFFVDNQSLVDTPTETVLRSTRDGSVVMKLQSAEVGELSKRKLALPEPFAATAADGKTPLYGVLYKPSNLDANKRYPVVEQVYTGPHRFNTPKSFGAGLRLDSAFAMAELGFVVVVVDGRGTNGRGRSFLDSAYHNLHAVGIDDHIAAIKAAAATRPYMNVSQVGVYGFSAGGYDVVRFMTRRPDFYQAGVAMAGNYDNRLDKSSWNEQWMGFPLGPHYETNSNVTWASKLQGQLLLAYPELDGNVPFFATMRLVDALIKAEKPFELLALPNEDHVITSVPYLHRRRFEFFLRNLPPPNTAAPAVASTTERQ